MKSAKKKSTYQNTSQIQPSVSPLLTHILSLAQPIASTPVYASTEATAFPWPTLLALERTSSAHLLSLERFRTKNRQEDSQSQSGAWYAYFLPHPARVRAF